MTKRYALYALAVIAVANFFSYLDRQLVSALEGPLRGAFTLDEKEFGALWTAFTLGYMACSPFIGYLSDHTRRTRLFAVCIFIWSLATIASGMARVTWILYASRVLIGLGEAGCLVVGSSLIADFFGRETRGRALSVFYLGLPVGGTAAFILAGLLLGEGDGAQTDHWRWLFYCAGAPGFILTLLIWTLVDPPRGGTEADDAGGHGAPKASIRDYLRLLKTPSLLLIILAQASAVTILVPLTHFGVEFFIQARGMGPKEARTALGIIALIAGVIGIALSGVVGDRLAKRMRGAYAWLAGVSFLVGFPCLLLGLLAKNPWVYLPFLTLGAFSIFFCMPAVNTQIANVSRPSQRAMAWALAVFVLHLLGDTFAPIGFGLVESVFKDPSFAVNQVDPAARETTLMIFSFSLIPASICCFIASRYARGDEERAEAETTAPSAEKGQ